MKKILLFSLLVLFMFCGEAIAKDCILNDFDSEVQEIFDQITKKYNLKEPYSVSPGDTFVFTAKSRPCAFTNLTIVVRTDSVYKEDNTLLAAIQRAILNAKINCLYYNESDVEDCKKSWQEVRSHQESME